MDTPSEEELRETRPMPCPGCESTKGFARIGKWRAQCLNCNSTFPNDEIGFENIDPQ